MKTMPTHNGKCRYYVTNVINDDNPIIVNNKKQCKDIKYNNTDFCVKSTKNSIHTNELSENSKRDISVFILK